MTPFNPDTAEYRYVYADMDSPYTSWLYEGEPIIVIDDMPDWQWMSYVVLPQE
jgi:hypothetical protein